MITYMRIGLLCLFLLVLVILPACGHKAQPVYKDAHITISGGLELIERVGIDDGGTELFKVRDAAGTIFELYVAQQLGNEAEWGQVYAHAYMGEPTSVKLEHQQAIQAILADVQQEGR